jgi:hypothetical protein
MVEAKQHPTITVKNKLSLSRTFCSLHQKQAFPQLTDNEMHIFGTANLYPFQRLPTLTGLSQHLRTLSMN